MGHYETWYDYNTVNTGVRDGIQIYSISFVNVTHFCMLTSIVTNEAVVTRHNVITVTSM
jgi:hypothetical protein